LSIFVKLSSKIILKESYRANRILLIYKWRVGLVVAGRLSL